MLVVILLKTNYNHFKTKHKTLFKIYKTIWMNFKNAIWINYHIAFLFKPLKQSKIVRLNNKNIMCFCKVAFKI